MRAIFCNDDLEPRAVDSCFLNEAEAAKSSGLPFELIDFNAARERNAERVVRFVAQKQHSETALYRGWMLTPEEYQCVYGALQTKSVRLINSPDEYVHCHWFPNSYPLIKDCTPFSVCIPTENGLIGVESVMNALKPFGASPVIVKDYVKSRKHEWFDACFIPNASDEAHVRRVVERFIELQGEDLQGGLVFREFVEFEPIGTHSKSGMPLTLEYRLFVHEGTVVATYPYWNAEYPAGPPPIDQFAEALKSIKSHFFSCDIAKTTRGRWLIVELGDGQVAGLPERCDVAEFYTTLSRVLQAETLP